MSEAEHDTAPRDAVGATVARAARGSQLAEAMVEAVDAQSYYAALAQAGIEDLLGSAAWQLARRAGLAGAGRQVLARVAAAHSDAAAWPPLAEILIDAARVADQERAAQVLRELGALPDEERGRVLSALTSAARETYRLAGGVEALRRETDLHALCARESAEDEVRQIEVVERAALAVAALRAGRQDAARGVVVDLAASGPVAVATAGLWLGVLAEAGVLGVLEVDGQRLGGADVAGQVLSRLRQTDRGGAAALLEQLAGALAVLPAWHPEATAFGGAHERDRWALASVRARGLAAWGPGLAHVARARLRLAALLALALYRFSNTAQIPVDMVDLRVLREMLADTQAARAMLLRRPQAADDELGGEVFEDLLPPADQPQAEATFAAWQHEALTVLDAHLRDAAVRSGHSNGQVQLRERTDALREPRR